MQHTSPGTLYLVSTPIGNLEDITLRALRILKEVDLIAAEDTRQTRRLLTHYDIQTPLTSYFEGNADAKSDKLIARLQTGEKIALVSDAGTPIISDPGIHSCAAALLQKSRLFRFRGHRQSSRRHPFRVYRSITSPLKAFSLQNQEKETPIKCIR